MTTPTDTKYIVRDPDVLGGKPAIEGYRIAVHHIAWWYSQGESAEQIARDFHVAPAEVHSALVAWRTRAAIEERKRRMVNDTQSVGVRGTFSPPPEPYSGTSVLRARSTTSQADSVWLIPRRFPSPAPSPCTIGTNRQRVEGAFSSRPPCAGSFTAATRKTRDGT